MRFAHALSLIDYKSEAGQSTPIPDDQRGFIGISAANDPATVDITTLFSTQATGLVSFTGFGGVSVGSDFLIILAPTLFLVQQIFDPQVQINEIAGYTITADVRTIEAESFTSYVLGPLNPLLSFTRTVSTAAP